MSTAALEARLEAALMEAGLSPEAAASKAGLFARCRAELGTLAPGAALRAWFVPGRIEVAGKHTDYAGGRSLVCALERGICLLAAPRPDRRLRLVDLEAARARADFPLEGPAPAIPPWVQYPATVARRLARDFAPLCWGADIVFASDLPQAAGLSSSSALIIATWFALAAANGLALPGPLELAGYLAAVESGRAWGDFPADGGVGTHGGSEDHTAILCSRPGRLGQYSYSPLNLEAEIRLPEDLIFAVGSSGVVARKTGNAAAAYNHLAAMAGAVLARWNQAQGRQDSTLAAALRAGSLEQLLAALPPEDSGLLDRLEHFVTESDVIVPSLGHALAERDYGQVGELARRSHELAARCLGNQVPQTDALVTWARTQGALAASAFGAGFGGAVWALLERRRAPQFLRAWQSVYQAQFPESAARSQFFLTGAGPAAFELPAHVFLSEDPAPHEQFQS